MGISIDEVRRVAALARLEFEGDEIETLTRDLGAILDYVERLRRADTAAVDAFPGEPAADAALRSDEPAAGLSPGDALAPAPEHSAGHFRVPRVIA